MSGKDSLEKTGGSLLDFGSLGKVTPPENMTMPVNIPRLHCYECHEDRDARVGKAKKCPKCQSKYWDNREYFEKKFEAQLKLPVDQRSQVEIKPRKGRYIKKFCNHSTCKVYFFRKIREVRKAVAPETGTELKAG